MNCRQSVAQKRSQRGLATVEMALVTPFLLVIMLATFELTRVFNEYNTLTKGVRDAARFMAKDSYNSANVFVSGDTARAKNIVVYGNIAGSGSPVLQGLTEADISIAPLNPPLGTAPFQREHWVVTANYEFVAVPGIIAGLGFLPGDISLDFTLTATSTMRAL